LKMKSYYYSGDPYFTTAKFTSTCTRCKEQISRGERIFYFPRTKDVYCAGDGCGGAESRSFEAAAQDEYFYNRG